MPLQGGCKGSRKESRRLRGPLGSPQYSGEGRQYGRHMAGTVTQIVHCTKGLATWVSRLESSCTLLPETCLGMKWHWPRVAS